MLLLDTFKERFFKYWAGQTSERKFTDVLSRLKDNLEYYLLNERPFLLERCSGCQEFKWGSYTGRHDNLKVDWDSGEVPCCSNGKNIWEIDYYGEERVSAEEALEHKVCSRYKSDFEDDLPFTRGEVLKYIRTQKEAIEILGFKPGEYFIDNLEKVPIIDLSKVNLKNSKEHLEIIYGNKKIPLEFYSVDKLVSRFNETTSEEAVPSKSEMNNITFELWDFYKKDKDQLKKLAPIIAADLLEKHMWTIEEYGLAQIVLFDYLVTREELKQFKEAADVKHIWYDDLHTFVNDKERKGVVKGLMRFIQGVSAAMADE